VGIRPYIREMMKILDAQYTKTPFYGVLKMTKHLRENGYKVGKARVRRLLRLMGLSAISCKRNLSKRNLKHKVYPYLLRGVEITKANQVWSADITYIPLERGFAYLTAIIDWWSRYVLSWRLSNTLEADFCTEALKEALKKYGVPEIFNSDQGS
jgi:putative transposase